MSENVSEQGALIHLNLLGRLINLDFLYNILKFYHLFFLATSLFLHSAGFIEFFLLLFYLLV